MLNNELPILNNELIKNKKACLNRQAFATPVRYRSGQKKTATRPALAGKTGKALISHLVF
jgi:hypothetical protein